MATLGTQLAATGRRNRFLKVRHPFGLIGPLEYLCWLGDEMPWGKGLKSDRWFTPALVTFVGANLRRAQHPASWRSVADKIFHDPLAFLRKNLALLYWSNRTSDIFEMLSPTKVHAMKPKHFRLLLKIKAGMIHLIR